MKSSGSSPKPLNIYLWIVQILLAVTLIWAGWMKLFATEKLPWPWVQENPGLAKISALFDLLAGVGLVLPWSSGIRPRLTVLAAYGLVVLMIAASIFHISRGEGSNIGFNVGVIFLAAFVAWGRNRVWRANSKR